MKHYSVVRLFVVLGLVALSVPLYANCFYPSSSTTYCYQPYPCQPPSPGQPFWVCPDGFYVAGECSTECDGNTYCTGVNQNCAFTHVEFTGQCPPICE